MNILTELLDLQYERNSHRQTSVTIYCQGQNFLKLRQSVLKFPNGAKQDVQKCMTFPGE